MKQTIAILDEFVRPELDGRLPDWIEPRWFSSHEMLLEKIADAEIGWIEAWQPDKLAEAIEHGKQLKWMVTVGAGVERYPFSTMRERGIVLTNAAGLNATAIAEYAVLGLLTIAKGYRDVVRAQDRHEWLPDSPGKQQLFGSRALIIGGGGIGGTIAALLKPFDVEVVTVRRRPAPGAIGPGAWRARLGEFDWVIVTAPSTPETRGMIGAAELAAMKPGSSILNFSRGDTIDQDALLGALQGGRLGGAFLDVTDPEPLPPEHPLWSFDNVHITMHLSGRSQTGLVERCVKLFLENLERYRRGEPLGSTVDLTLGY